MINSLFLGLQSVQSAPRRIAGRLGGIGGRLRKACWTGLASIRITPGMSWKSKMYILSKLLGQVNRLPTVEFLLESKVLDRQCGLKVIETGHTPQAKTKFEPTGGEETTAGEPDIQRISERRAGTSASLFQFQEAGFFNALQMKSAALRNLAQMNLHSSTLHAEAGTFNAQV
jgi:hypothetical protein